MSPPLARPDDASRLRGLRRLARLLDRQFRIPGTRIRLGLDPLIGLLPGIGDVATGALSGWIVIAAARLGAPAPVLARMLFNLLTDVVLGAVPLLGDLFDVAWKANARNLDLLERHLADPRRARRSSVLAVTVVTGVVLLLIGFAAWGLAVIVGG
ncbi:MAG: DUF4112 domain-containing protein [Longimicrobiales bacterium]